MIPLAWKNVIHKKFRTAVAVSGVSFSILMIFLQLGFFGAVENTANQVFDRFDFDLVLISPHYRMIAMSNFFPRRRIYQAKAHPDVKNSIPIYAHADKWKNVETDAKRTLLVLGFNPRDYPFRDDQIKKYLPALQQSDTLLMDKLSLPLLGPREVGTVSEIKNRKVRVGGLFEWGVGLSADGAVLVSDQNYLRLFPDKPLSHVSLGLVTLEDGIPTEAAKHSLRQALPSDVQVLTRKELGEVEMEFWLSATSTGPMFGAGVAVAFIVGMVILYQILSTEIMDNIKEYATLKAMGYENQYFSKVVLQHGALIAILGYLPAYGLSFGLYHITRVATFLPVYMTTPRAVFVLVLSVMMCTASAYLSLNKVKMADPGDLF